MFIWLEIWFFWSKFEEVKVFYVMYLVGKYCKCLFLFLLLCYGWLSGNKIEIFLVIEYWILIYVGIFLVDWLDVILLLNLLFGYLFSFIMKGNEFVVYINFFFLIYIV